MLFRSGVFHATGKIRAMVMTMAAPVMPMLVFLSRLIWFLSIQVPTSGWENAATSEESATMSPMLVLEKPRRFKKTAAKLKTLQKVVQ